ncbi:hypothetical protein THRCLA_07677 [Thraustotheca clavata]|uniref:Major Facilitator Superfamily (MFS) n=1 Tax=Thraustotheca clavata TaxID=74557 RepID=A0A1V9ZCD1_9STRA|nr:hypothetical protein THRCLA_07677 [Thraustotheca clavata]
MADDSINYELVQEPKKDRLLHILLIGTSLAANLLFGGFIFGWAAVLLLLQEERQYSELCSATDELNAVTHTCVAQDNRLNVIFGVAQVVYTVSSFPVGVLLDKVDSCTMTVLAGILNTLGLFLMAYSESTGFNAFVIGYTCLALGGIMTLLIGFQSGFVVVKWQTAILTCVNCIFDASAGIPSLLYLIHETSGFSRKEIIFFYAILSGALFLFWALLWYKYNTTKHNSQESIQESSTIQELDLRQAPLKSKLKTFEFAYLLFVTIAHRLHNAIYLGTVNQTLAYYDDTTHVYTKVFGWVLSAGFAYIPLIHVVTDRLGLAASFHATTIFCICYHIFTFIPSLPVQVASFITFVGFRAFLFVSNTAFAADVFGPTHMGTIVGITYCISGLVALVEIPAATYTNSSWTGWCVIYSLSLLLAVLVLPATEWYRRRLPTKV